MPVAMHAKSDSDVTCSVDGGASSPPRSPTRRHLYYVQSPSNHDYGAADKMSYGSSPPGSPTHHPHPAAAANNQLAHYYHCSPIHHSRESSTSRFSASLRNPRGGLSSSSAAWRKLQGGHGPEIGGDDDDDEDGLDDDRPWHSVRLYAGFVLLFVLVFTVFGLILWGASKSYRPEIVVKNIVFENFYIQAGNDQSGVPTDMLTLNSTVRVFYRNPSTFFGVHVTATPLQLHYFQLEVASGHMKKFYQSRKSQRAVVTVVAGHQVPLYGGVSVLNNAREHLENVAVPLNLTFVMRSRAYIMGKLVKSKFYRRVRCPVTLRGNKLGMPLKLTNLCTYH